MAATDVPISARKAALMCGVDPRTMARWCHDGRIEAIKLPSGHYRLNPAVVRALLEPVPNGTPGRAS